MTEAEKILNKFIKGDIARDYDEASRKNHTITLQTALEAINVALNKPNVSGQSEQLKAFLDEIANDKTYILNDYYKNKAKRLSKSLNCH